MSQEPKNASEGRMITMPKWLWRDLLALRHMIEDERERTIPSGEETRIVAQAGLAHVRNCKACRAGEDCPDVNWTSADASSPEPKQAPVKASRSPRSKASG